MTNPNKFKVTDQVTFVTPEGERPAEGIPLTAESDAFAGYLEQSEVLSPATSGTNMTIPVESKIVHVDSTGEIDVVLSAAGGGFTLPLGQPNAATAADEGDPSLISITLVLNSASTAPLTATGGHLRAINRNDDDVRVTFKVGT